MYSTTVDGEALQFGTSGFLYRSNKLMYDRKTNTLWNQFLGEPVVGPLADSGTRLELLPVLVTTWAEWVGEHPDTTVLDINTGVYAAPLYRVESDPMSTYFSYRASPEPIFPVGPESNLLLSKTEVLGLHFDGVARAYPLVLLREEGLANDTVGGRNVVVVPERAPGAARAYARGELTFSVAGRPEGAAPAVLLDQHGRRWRVEEGALVQEAAPSGLRLERLPSRVAFWFGWYAFFPMTTVYEPAGAGG